MVEWWVIGVAVGRGLQKYSKEEPGEKSSDRSQSEEVEGVCRGKGNVVFVLYWFSSLAILLGKRFQVPNHKSCQLGLPEWGFGK